MLYGEAVQKVEDEGGKDPIGLIERLYFVEGVIRDCDYRVLCTRFMDADPFDGYEPSFM